MNIKYGLAWAAFVIVAIIVAMGTYSYFSRSLAQAGPSLPSGAVTFYCTQGEVVGTFATDTVTLALPDSRLLTLPQTVSGSGIRYESTSTAVDELFESEGDWAQLTENDQTTYDNCRAAHVIESYGEPGERIYTDQSNTFSFVFPDAFLIVGDEPGYGTDWMTNTTASGMLLAEVDMLRTEQPQTNFGGARVTFGTSADPTAVAGCLTYNPGGDQTQVPSTTVINGVTFTKFISSDAGAGNFYNTTSYRTVRGGQCYALEYTIHSTNIGDYPAGTVQGFDVNAVQAQLEKVVQSFKFLN